MKNKIFLFLALVSYLALTSCGKGTRPNVTFIGDIKEESQTRARDGSYIYSHFLNVSNVSFYNERKLNPIPVLAELKLFHLGGFKNLVKNPVKLEYKLFAGDSTERVYTQKDSALMVLVGMSATITDEAGNKVVDVKDILIPTQVGTAKFPYHVDSTNLNGKCISVKEHLSWLVKMDRNDYYKNLTLQIMSNPAVFKKEQKYKLHFRVFDKVDPNRYFEGQTKFTAYR
jgi:hypothetical protein